MANAYKIYNLCGECGGAGTTSDATGSRECKMCHGKKVMLAGYCTEAVTDIPALDEE